jgi:TonB family protein
MQCHCKQSPACWSSWRRAIISVHAGVRLVHTKITQEAMEPAVDPSPEDADQPALLVELDPWHVVFLRNLRDLVSRAVEQDYQLSSSPGQFWPDVFLGSGLPWKSLGQSAGLHIAAMVLIWGIAGLWAQTRQPRIATQATENIIYYSPSEYLPQLDTAFVRKRVHQRGEPEHARQAILSLPAEPDNRTQTIVSPPSVRLKDEVLLPNIVAWSEAQPLVPMATTERISRDFKLPAMPLAIVAPLPAVTREFTQTAPGLPQQVVAPAPTLNVGSPARSMQAPATAVISPPPSLQAVVPHTLGQINIAENQVVAPAPALPLEAQRAIAGSAAVAGGKVGSAVVPPPPSVPAARGPDARGRLIALGIHPASLTASVRAPEGNRRGTFAATPTSKIGARGTPDLNETGERGSGSGPAMAGIPEGISVGAPGQPGAAKSDLSGIAGQGSQPKNGGSRLVANAHPPDVTHSQRPSEMSGDNASDLDRKVFGDRKFYAMSLNMPNLNSAAGSWIIRFAELKEDQNKGELTAPVATQKVDPAYPTELMRHNVHGTVTLRAIIRSDGTVAEVSVLRGIDDRLDQYACTALSRWHFVPATKNGSAVDLEAVVIIPFRSTRTRSGF